MINSTKIKNPNRKLMKIKNLKSQKLKIMFFQKKIDDIKIIILSSTNLFLNLLYSLFNILLYLIL